MQVLRVILHRVVSIKASIDKSSMQFRKLDAEAWHVTEDYN